MYAHVSNDFSMYRTSKLILTQSKRTHTHIPSARKKKTFKEELTFVFVKHEGRSGPNVNLFLILLFSSIPILKKMMALAIQGPVIMSKTCSLGNSTFNKKAKGKLNRKKG